MNDDLPEELKQDGWTKTEFKNYCKEGESKKITIKYKKLHPDAKAPYRKHVDDAGFDLTAVSYRYNKTYGVCEYGTGLAFELPSGLWGDLRPRSSIYKTGLMLCNSCGTLDAPYRGEVTAKFYQIEKETCQPYEIGNRILQLIIIGASPTDVEFVEVDDLSETDRGTGGYGSTGK